jgi:hypothetical protein
LFIDISGQTIGPILTLEDVVDTLSRKSKIATNVCCVTSQKSGDLVKKLLGLGKPCQPNTSCAAVLLVFEVKGKFLFVSAMEAYRGEK